MSDPQKLKEEADKLASSSGGFFSKIFGGGNKLEEACELYTQGEIFCQKFFIIFFKREAESAKPSFASNILNFYF